MYEGFYDVLIYPLQGILRTVHIIDLLYLHPRNITYLVRNLIVMTFGRACSRSTMSKQDLTLFSLTRSLHHQCYVD